MHAMRTIGERNTVLRSSIIQRPGHRKLFTHNVFGSLLVVLWLGMAACDAAGTTTAAPATGATDSTPTGTALSATVSPIAPTATGAVASPANQATISTSTAQVSPSAIAPTLATNPTTSAAASPTASAVTPEKYAYTNCVFHAIGTARNPCKLL